MVVGRGMEEEEGQVKKAEIETLPQNPIPEVTDPLQSIPNNTYITDITDRYGFHNKNECYFAKNWRSIQE